MHEAPRPKPRPVVSVHDRPYWEALRQHLYRLQRCADCRTYRFPASPVCARCRSARHSWEISSGLGEVFSWVVFHRSYFPSFAQDIPYNVAMIRLDDGPIVIADIVGIANEAITKGLRVKVRFDDVDDDLTIPRFAPETRST